MYHVALRASLVFLVLMPLMSLAAAADERYGVALDTKTYPQATAKEALASVLQAIDAKKFDYLVAHLADPEFIDERVKKAYGGKFEEQVRDTQTRLDPATVKQLRRFAKDGKWAVDEDKATATLADVKDRVVRLIKKGDRWYLQHRFDGK